MGGVMLIYANDAPIHPQLACIYGAHIIHFDRNRLKLYFCGSVCVQISNLFLHQDLCG
jgi:hypothetical protein